jgi:hypothetical protein
MPSSIYCERPQPAQLKQFAPQSARSTPAQIRSIIPTCGRLKTPGIIVDDALDSSTRRGHS